MQPTDLPADPTPDVPFAPAPDGPGGLPPPPRPATARARRRAWADPPVRLWWVAAAAIGLAAVYLLATQWLVWRREARLVDTGVKVTAKVLQANEQTLAGRKQPPDAVVRMEFPWKDGRREVTGQLEGRQIGDFIAPGDTVPLRVDPNDPDRWTARTERPSLAVQCLGGLIAAGIAAVAGLVAVVARRPVLRTWRTGTVAPAAVVGRQRTALAPGSWAVRCTLAADAAGDAGAAGGMGGRVFVVYVPARRLPADGPPGDLWVIVPPRGGRPVAVDWFV